VTRDATISPLQSLRAAVDSFAPHLREDGEVVDPVFGEPTQYGTPYHALCRAVLSRFDDDPQQLDRAARGLDASLRHLEDPNLAPNLSGFEVEAVQVRTMNHRDFFWPAVLKTWLLLRDAGHSDADAFGKRIAAVRVPDVFRNMPDSNWAAVWISGEWLRMREGLSDVSDEQFDAWVGAFFQRRIDLAAGFYHEPGHPNSYDLFTRYHLADMLLCGYDGGHRGKLERLMATGLRRSLALQLSDGSLASAFRSTGQTWTLGCQIAYFTLAARWFDDYDPSLAAAARQAASRAFASFARFQREGGPYSPVENVLPSAMRVGYEAYTFDANYSNLAMGFLAVAIGNGFEQPAALQPRAASGFIEHDPTWRALAHRGDISVHVNALPSAKYDAFGLVDLTFGPHRMFHFVGSAAPLADPMRHVNIGVAARAGLSADGNLTPMCRRDLRLIEPIEAVADAALHLHARIVGSEQRYELWVEITDAGVDIAETWHGDGGYKSLLIPCLVDNGATKTRVDVDGQTVTFTHGEEVIACEIWNKFAGVLAVPNGYQSRRGLCGMVRIDLAEPGVAVQYRFRVVA